MKTFLLDTTAVLAHYLDEDGAQFVEEIMEDTAARIIVVSLTASEFARRINAMIVDPASTREVALKYLQLFDAVLPVDVPICTRAFELSATASERVPLVNSLIAAAAQVSEAILVHRDRNFLSMKSVKQQYLD